MKNIVYAFWWYEEFFADSLTLYQIKFLLEKGLKLT